MKTLCYKSMYLLALVAAFVFTSCADDDHSMPNTPQIYIDRPDYSMVKSDVDITVKADVAPTTDIAIPLVFGGTAVRDFDFTCDSDIVVIPAGQTEGHITLKRIENNMTDDTKELYVNLGSAPHGYMLGLMNYASVKLLGNNGFMMSFSAREMSIGDIGEVVMSLTNSKGEVYKVTQNTPFALEVDPSSTAVAGVNYEFADGSQITVRRNRNSGKTQIKMLKYEKDHDLLVLRFAPVDGGGDGNIAKMTIRLKPRDIFSGTWVLDSIDLSEIELYGTENPDLAPKKGTNEVLTFSPSTDGNSYTMTTNFNGDLAKYFLNGSHNVTYKGVANYTANPNVAGNFLSVLKVSNINQYFSSNASNIVDANIGFKLTKDSSGNDVLVCAIDDWVPQTGEYGYSIYDAFYSMTDGRIYLYFKKK